MRSGFCSRPSPRVSRAPSNMAASTAGSTRFYPLPAAPALASSISTCACWPKSRNPPPRAASEAGSSTTCLPLPLPRLPCPPVPPFASSGPNPGLTWFSGPKPGLTWFSLHFVMVHLPPTINAAMPTGMANAASITVMNRLLISGDAPSLSVSAPVPSISVASTAMGPSPLPPACSCSASPLPSSVPPPPTTMLPASVPAPGPRPTGEPDGLLAGEGSTEGVACGSSTTGVSPGPAVSGPVPGDVSAGSGVGETLGAGYGLGEGYEKPQFISFPLESRAHARHWSEPGPQQRLQVGWHLPHCSLERAYCPAPQPKHCP